MDTDLPSPSFVVVLPTLEANCKRIAEKVKSHGLSLRPHVKTHKTVEAALLQTAEFGGKTCGIVVSTLKEAEFFADAGFEDILYAVILEPSKLPRCKALAQRLRNFHVLVDSLEAVAMLEGNPPSPGGRWSVFTKVDCGYHRAGLPPTGAVAVATAISGGSATSLAGLYAHSGNSYNCPGDTQEAVKGAVSAIVSTEVTTIVGVRDTLVSSGVAVPVVSVGATPSVSIGGDFTGVTEVHPGNYCFYDRQQVASGSCSLADVACYVVARVLSTYPERNEFLVDAGGCALHKDPAGIAHFGVLLDEPSLYVDRISQECGVVTSEAPLDFSRFPIGTVIRIVPNHSCMTASCHRQHHVVNERRELVGTWTPCSGW